MSPVHSAIILRIHNFVKITLCRTLCFRDKCAFALYAEIQDGCQKWRESDFLRKVVSRLGRYPMGQKFVEITLSRTIFEIPFYAEIQDGHQKWRKSDFCEKLTVHSGHPGGKKFPRKPHKGDRSQFVFFHFR